MAGVKGRSGGARIGAGRKRRDPAAAWLSGARAKTGPRPVSTPTGTIQPPRSLTPDERTVWNELAPHAIANGSLIPAHLLAFVLLCQNVVMERKLRVAPLTAAGPDHRGMLQQVTNGLTRFRLIADGKPVVTEKTVDEWDEFDGPTLVKGAGA